MYLTAVIEGRQMPVKGSRQLTAKTINFYAPPQRM